MGVPGLKRWVEKRCAVQHKCSGFKNCRFYIDGLNLLFKAYDYMPRDGKQSTYEKFSSTIVPIIHNILRLKPLTVTIYFDVRLPTVDNTLKQVTRRPRNHVVDTYRPFMGHELFIFLIKKHFPKINIVLTATDAEDLIANDIFRAYEVEVESDQYFHHVIISDDSDCYTFELPNSYWVQIVPLFDLCQEWPWRRITAVNLNLAYSMVSPRYHKAVPLPQKDIRLGKHKGIYENTRKTRMLVEFLHTINHYDVPMICLALIPSPPDVPEPYKIGISIRLTMYGLMLQQYGVGDFIGVAERQQRGDRIVTKKHYIFPSDTLKDQVEYLTSTPLREIIMDEFEDEDVKSCFGITSRQISAVGAYVADLQKGSDIYKMEVLYHAAPKLYTLLQVVLLSLQLFYGTSKCFFDDSTYLLLWKIDPYELSTYLYLSRQTLDFLLLID